MTEQKFKSWEIKDLTKQDSDLLTAVIRLCKSAVWLKKHVSVDTEWDYKLGKAFATYGKDIEHLAEMPAGFHTENTYKGTLTIERLLNEFEDFNSLLSSSYPLDDTDADFVISYGFLEGKVQFIKSIISAQKHERPENITSKVNWEKWGVILTLVSIFVAILLAVIFN